MLDIPEEEEGESWTVMNFDWGDMISVDRPVWEQDALLTDEVMVWLEEMIATLEDPLETTLDVTDLWEDMTVEEWEQLLEDVCNDDVV